MVSEVKTCRKCGLKKLLSEFHSRLPRRTGQLQKDGVRGTCKSCNLVTQKERRYRSRGSSIAEYKELLKLQEGKCAICSRAVELYLDHSHITNSRRGLLCRECNLILGLCDDDLGILESAAIYIRHYDGT